MNNRYGRRSGLAGQLLISLASGTILAVASWLLTDFLPDVFTGSVPTWLFVAATPTAALLALFIARHLGSGSRQALVLISAFTQTRWLADLLADLSRSLDRHGVDLVVKLPQHDHSGRGPLQQLAKLKERRRSYVGGFVMLERPEHVQSELIDLCREIARPVVFVDVRPIRAATYPARAAFVGSDPDAIGEKAGRWAGKELIERGVEAPSVLVVGCDSQSGRQVRFEATLREMLPSSKLEVSELGLFSRERAREIVDQHLRHVTRRQQGLDAIFCTNDEMALGAVDAVQEHAAAGNHFDGLIILGVDGIAEAIATIKAGTTAFQATVVQDTRRIAEVAVDVLLRMSSGERVPVETFVPTTVYPMR